MLPFCLMMWLWCYFGYWYTFKRGAYVEPGEWYFEDDAASNATVETLAYSGDGNDDAWSACGTEAGEE
jgi:hypothetical protein